MEFFVPNKHAAGGQSALRYKRQTEHLAETFYKLVAERANKVFTEIPSLKALLLLDQDQRRRSSLRRVNLTIGLEIRSSPSYQHAARTLVVSLRLLGTPRINLRRPSMSRLRN